MSITQNSFSPRKQVETVLKGGVCKRIPFTMYENKVPQCSAEREMRNAGLCIVDRRVNVFKSHRPNVKVSANISYDSGKPIQETFFETSKGILSKKSESAGFTNWVHEKLFKTPDDYKAILAFIEDEEFEPCYDSFLKAQEAKGEDVILRAGFGLEPMQALISGDIMDMQDFCIEWMDNRDEILKLYSALVENRRKTYQIIAESPALHANYGGNVTPQIIGLDIFEQYYLPHYHEAAEVMHQHGKLIGCHFDADCKLLSKAIASTPLDYIEAFTPFPGTDMTLAEARKIWPDKVLWVNFPSALHLKNDEEVRQVTYDLAQEAGGYEGLIMGITEDIPEHRWRDSCRAIMKGLEEHSQQYPRGISQNKNSDDMDYHELVQ